MAYSSSAPIIIDLDQFKLHLNIQGIRQLSLHFDTPSRRFYLSVIALVVEQMRKSDKIRSVPLENHAGILALLNETVGGSAGSSKVDKLLAADLPEVEGCPSGSGKCVPFQGDRHEKGI